MEVRSVDLSDYPPEWEEEPTGTPLAVNTERLLVDFLRSGRNTQFIKADLSRWGRSRRHLAPSEREHRRSI